MCNLCKGISPCCNNCNTMGISNEFDNYKPVYLNERMVVNKIVLPCIDLNINKKTKDDVKYKSRTNEAIVKYDYKMELRRKRKEREHLKEKLNRYYPKLGDKYKDLFNHLYLQFQNN